MLAPQANVLDVIMLDVIMLNQGREQIIIINISDAEQKLSLVSV